MHKKEKCYQKSYRGKYVDFYPKVSNFALKYDLAGYFDPRPQIHICLGWGNLFINLPFKSKYNECEPPRYGVYYHERCFWFPHGRKIYCLHLPFEYDWVRTSYLRSDNTWENETKGNSKNFWKDEEWKDILWKEVYPYTYTLKNGTSQNRQATVKVVEREWRWRSLKWTKITAMKRRVIDVEFDGEIGEKTGSYKGGCIGCSYDLLPNETPLESLRRMESERVFK